MKARPDCVLLENGVECMGYQEMREAWLEAEERIAELERRLKLMREWTSKHYLDHPEAADWFDHEGNVK